MSKPTVCFMSRPTVLLGNVLVCEICAIATDDTILIKHIESSGIFYS